MNDIASTATASTVTATTRSPHPATAILIFFALIALVYLGAHDPEHAAEHAVQGVLDIALALAPGLVARRVATAVGAP